MNFLSSSNGTGQRAGFEEIWVEIVRNIYAVLEETEVIRFTRPDGTAVWVTTVVVGILDGTGEIDHLTVYGVTENGDHVKDEFLDCADDYPDEVAPLIPVIIKASKKGSE